MTTERRHPRRARPPRSLVGALLAAAWLAAGAGCGTGTGGGDADLPNDAGPDHCHMMFIDFPCQPETYVACKDARTYVRWETVGCADLGLDPQCCSGLTCRPSDVQACPDGTFCWDARDASGGCRAAECGRPGDPACAADTFCETAQGDCAATAGGFCRSRTDCTLTGQPDNPKGWVCGCDQVSYADDCARRAAGVARQALGPCCDPAKRQLDPANPDGWTYWLLCGEGDAGLVAAFNFLDAAGGYHTPKGECVQPNVGATWGCSAGEWACRGRLQVAPTPAIPQDQWDWLCLLTGLPGVKRLVGSPGPS